MTPVEIDRSRAARRARLAALPQVEAALLPHVSQIEKFPGDVEHWRLKTRSGWVVDFWPATETWMEPRRGRRSRSQGLGQLIAELDAHRGAAA